MAQSNGSMVKSPILVRERRAALVRAAVEVFSEKGFHVGTVNEIARRAGMSQGSVYNYIGSKADMLYLVCSDVYAAFERRVTEAVEDAETPTVRLRKAIEATVDASLELQDHLLLLYQELHCLDRKSWRPFLRDAAKLRSLYERILSDVSRTDRTSFGDRRVAATIVLMLPSALIMRRWDLRGKVPEARVRTEAIRFLLNGLGIADVAKRADGGHRGVARRTGTRRAIVQTQPSRVA